MAKALFYLIVFFGIILMGIGYYSIFIILKFRILAKKYYPDILKKYSKNFKWGFKLLYDKKIFDNDQVEKLRIRMRNIYTIGGLIILIGAILVFILIKINS